MKRYDFYPRPPRGGRLAAALQAKVEQLFLSTPSARRATPEYQLPGCAERISIHALREEGDWLLSQIYCRQQLFLSTPSARRATRIKVKLYFVDGDFYPRPPRGGRRP